MTGERVLIVDDSEATLDVLERNMSALGFEVKCAAGAEMALDHLDADSFDLLITDIKMPGMSGMELLLAAKKKYPDLPVMMITGYATVPGAVKAMESGALEYLSKPFTKAEFSEAVRKVMEKASVTREAGRPPSREPGRRFGLVGKAPSMAAVFSALELAADDEGAPILFLGETGTGKRASARGIAGDGPFAEISGDMIVRGGVPNIRGILYVPGIDMLPPHALRALESETRKKRKGGDRVIAGASPGIVGRPALKSFCSRFSPHVITLPPLRERPGDIRRLLLSSAMSVLPSPPPCWPLFSNELLGFLESYDWPGNVSELLTAAAELFSGFRGRALEPADLPPRFTKLIEAGAPARIGPLAEAETAHIRRVLESVGGNKSKAAEILGITRKTLAQKLKEQ